jgi:hypothetical protein
MSIVDVQCDAMRIADRHRNNLGDLESLAASARDVAGIIGKIFPY